MCDPRLDLIFAKKMLDLNLVKSLRPTATHMQWDRTNLPPQARSQTHSGGDPEELPHVQGAATARVQEGREELLHAQGQEGRPWGDTPRPR